jgi:hypothetical protein
VQGGAVAGDRRIGRQDDFFHTAAGQPVYLECADNYQDMRERFAALLPRFRQALGLPAEAVVTCIIDRGIFSHEVFAKAVEAPDYHLITWEKNFQPGPWDPQKCSGQYALERTRNHAQDKRVYRFEYRDQDWAKNAQMRQLIVRATNPQGSLIQVGILTDDRQRAATRGGCLPAKETTPAPRSRRPPPGSASPKGAAPRCGSIQKSLQRSLMPRGKF